MVVLLSSSLLLTNSLTKLPYSVHSRFKFSPLYTFLHEILFDQSKLNKLFFLSQFPSRPSIQIKAKKKVMSSIESVEKKEIMLKDDSNPFLSQNENVHHPSPTPSLSPSSSPSLSPSSSSAMSVAGFELEGVSVGGQETCIIFPSFKFAFDIGRCPQKAIFQEYLFISHSHIDHIGGIAFYVATRGLLGLKPPTIIMPPGIVPAVRKLLECFRELDGSLLECNLIGLKIGEEFTTRNGFRIKPFKTYHVIESQGYVVYSVKKKLKQMYLGLPGEEIKKLKSSGIEVTDTVVSPEIAFTGDTTSDFVTDPCNADALKAKLLIMECTFLDDSVGVDHAREFGHIHLSEVLSLADYFQNSKILFIHFSARYKKKDIIKCIDEIVPSKLKEKIIPLLEKF